MKLALVAQGYGPVNAVARRMGAALYVIDVGLQKETDSLPGVTSEKIVHGTHLGMPAMTKEEAEKAVAVGRAVGSSLAQQNVQAVGMGKYRREIYAVGYGNHGGSHGGGTAACGIAEGISYQDA